MSTVSFLFNGAVSRTARPLNERGRRCHRCCGYTRPLHPYTQVLLAATPSIRPDSTKPKIKVSGELPNPLDPPTGCVFHTRCPHATERCTSEVPAFRPVDDRLVACHYAEEVGSTRQTASVA
ncbi:hypothetical protein CXK96_10305 [Stutzerimonas stutzeri]|nr:hypothetical protein CXK96_10305 [Stutzerimonas stutzeri]